MKNTIFLIILIATIVSLLVFPEYFIITTLLFGAAIFILFKTDLIVGEEKEEVQTEEPELKKDGENLDWESDVTTIDAYRYLLHANYNLRVHGRDISDEDAESIEELIDDLRNLVLSIEDSSSVLKWKVNQICMDFIPKLINRFISATSTSRVEIMSVTIRDIKEKIRQIETTVQTNNQEEFEHFANTLQKIMKA